MSVALGRSALDHEYMGEGEGYLSVLGDSMFRKIKSEDIGDG